MRFNGRSGPITARRTAGAVGVQRELDVLVERCLDQIDFAPLIVAGLGPLSTARTSGPAATSASRRDRRVRMTAFGDSFSRMNSPSLSWAADTLADTSADVLTDGAGAPSARCLSSRRGSQDGAPISRRALWPEAAAAITSGDRR